jgi:WD40 repeat protein
MITTFYSFKGGVGRSHALLETAAQLALRGRSVLVWDLDLEAPGIQKLPALRDIDAAMSIGTLDLLRRFEETNYEFPDESIASAIVDLKDERIARASGKLSFLLPARVGDDYPGLFGSIDWSRLFAPATGPGPAFFHRLARQLTEKHGFDHVLIDSRTGLTNLSAICTLQLPDFVVLVFNLNEQNLDAIVRMWNVVTRTQTRTGAQMQVFTVANMIPRDLHGLDGARKRLVRARTEEKLATLRQTFPLALDLPLHPSRFITDEIPSLDGVKEEVAELEPLVERLELQRRQMEADARAESASDATRQPEIEPSDTFVSRVGHLFHLLGYTILFEYEFAGISLRFDLCVEMADGPVPSFLLIECKDSEQPVIADEVRAFAARVEEASRLERRRYQAIFVARTQFAANVADVAAELFVQLRTWDELLFSLIDFGPAIDKTIRDFRGTAVERLYVEQRVIVESQIRPGEPVAQRGMTEFAEEWIARPGARFLALLGDFGSGKTTFAKRFAAQLADQWRERGTGSRIPVLIDLRNARSTTLSLENILIDHFARLSSRNFNIGALLHLNREGHLLLIFDGFDEMLGYSDPMQLGENLRQILRAAEGKAKVLLTCRTHYFRSRPDALTSVGGGSARTTTPLFDAVQAQPDSDIAYLLEFDRAGVAEYLRKAFPPPADAEALGEEIVHTYDLYDLAARPFLLELIVRTLPTLTEKAPSQRITVADLYELACDEWFQRVDSQLTLTRDRKVALVEYLARMIWDTPERTVRYDELADKLVEFYNDRPLTVIQKEKLDYEARTAVFLKRDAGGYYTFIHTSFLEYFIARIIRDGLRARDASVLNLRRLTKEIAYFLESWDEAALIPEVAGRVLSEKYEKRVSENALLLLYWHASAASGPLVGRGAEVHETAEATWKRRERFASMAPKTIALHAADLSATNLTGVDLSNAVLDGVDFTGAILRESDFNYASLARSRMGNADCRRSSFVGANLAASDLDHIDARKAAFVDAGLQGSDLRFGRFVGAAFGRANLEGCDATGASFLRALDLTASLDPTAGPSKPRQMQPILPVAGWSSVAFSPDGRFIVTGGDGIAIWDAETGAPIKCLTSDPVESVEWHPSKYLLAARSGNHIVVWDLVTGEREEQFPWTGNSVGWSPSEESERVAVVGKSIEIREAQTMTPVRTIQPRGERFTPEAAAISGRRVAVCGSSTLQMIDTESGETLWRVHDERSAFRAIWSESDALAVTDGNTVTFITASEPPASDRFGGVIRNVAVARNGEYAAVVGQTILAGTLGMKPRLTRRQSQSIEVAAIDRRASRVAYSHTHGVWILDVHTDTVINPLKQGNIQRLAWNDEGNLLAVFHSNAEVFVYDVERDEFLSAKAVSLLPTMMALSADGRYAAFASSEPVTIVDFHSGQFFNLAERASFVAWSEGDQLATATNDGKIGIWDSGRKKIHSWQLAASRVSSLAWRPDNHALAIGLQRSVAIWHVGGDRSERAASLVASPPDRLIAITEDGIADPRTGEVWFGDGWARYDAEDVPECFSSERVAAAMFAPPSTRRTRRNK